MSRQNLDLCLKLTDISFRYNSASPVILNKINLKINSGQKVAILGRSGCGKSTLLRLFNGLLSPSSGELTIFDKPITDWDPWLLKRQIGFVLQYAGLFPHLTVAQNMLALPMLDKWPDDKQQQRVAIGRAIAASPPLLLLDEAFSALDPVTKHQLKQDLMAIIAQLNLTAILVTHDVIEALEFADVVLVLEKGNLVFQGNKKDFFESQQAEVSLFRSLIPRVSV
jgi:osmoprotectant transport system ATP-binding protein